MLGPQELGVGGEALVQPDVTPVVDRHGVAEPLVGDLVCDDVGVGAAAEERVVVGRAGLVLQRVAEVGRHDAALGLERVRAEVLRQELGDLGGALDARLRGVGVLAEALE